MFTNSWTLYDTISFFRFASHIKLTNYVHESNQETNIYPIFDGNQKNIYNKRKEQEKHVTLIWDFNMWGGYKIFINFKSDWKCPTELTLCFSVVVFSTTVIYFIFILYVFEITQVDLNIRLCHNLSIHIVICWAHNKVLCG